MSTRTIRQCDAGRAPVKARLVGWWTALLLLNLALAPQVPAQQPQVEELVARLASRDVKVRRTAAGQLGELGTDARPAVPALARALADQDFGVRFFAAEALEAALPDGHEELAAVLATVERVYGKSGKERVDAILELGRPGIAEKVAPPVLWVLIEDPQTTLVYKYAAARALTNLQHVAKSDEPKLRSLLASKDSTLSALAAMLCSFSQTQPDEAIAVLKRQLGKSIPMADDDELLDALGRYGNRSAAQNALADFLFHDDRKLALRAAMALSRSKAKPKAAVPVLAQELNRAKTESLRELVTALARYGPAAKSVAPDLVPSLLEYTRQDPKSAEFVRDALKKIDLATAESYTQELARGNLTQRGGVVTGPDEPLRLPVPGKLDLLTRPELLKAIENVAYDLGNDSPLARQQASASADALVRRHGWTMIDLLCDSVTRNQPVSLRLTALGGWEALALGRRPTARRMAAMTFQVAMSDKDEAVRVRSCEAVVNVLAVRPNDSELLGILEQARKDASLRVRRMARQALERLARRKK